MNEGTLGAFLVRRIGLAVAFVLLVSVSALALARLAPGDAAFELVLAGADDASVEAARRHLGLDRPLAGQVVGWLVDLARLDLGHSWRFDRPVADLVTERAVNTAGLAALALLLATMVGLPLGVMTGARPRGLLGRIVTPVSVALVACPPIVGALGLLLVAAVTGWLSVAPGAWAIPTLALALPLAALIERLQSQATADTLSSPDLVAAAARGVPPARLLWVHTGRQALRPVLGVYGLIIGGLFSGSLAVEWITAWPGLGRLMYDALVSRDVFLVTGCALVGAVLIAAGNLIADILRALADPRVREGT